MIQSFVVVDDSRAIQSIIKRSIDASGYHGALVQMHSSAQAALDALDTAAGAPDLIITDWHMPGMSGLEFLQVLRQSHGKDLKVGMITTESSPDLLRQARNLGVEFILHKPFSDVEIREGIHKAIGPPQSADSPAPAAVPATEPATPDRDARLSALLTQTLGPIKFRLIPEAPPALSQLSPRVLLCLYSMASTKAAYALSVLDMHSVCMIGGGGLALQPAEVRPAMAADAATPAMQERTSQFLREASSVLTDAKGEVPAASRGTLVARELERLHEALASSREVLSYRLQIPGYGNGRLAFLVL